MSSCAMIKVLAAGVGIMLLLQGASCSTLRVGTEGIKAFYCGTDAKPGAYVPVRWSQRDTDETIAQVKANNSVWADACR